MQDHSHQGEVDDLMRGWDGGIRVSVRGRGGGGGGGVRGGGVWERAAGAFTSRGR